MKENVKIISSNKVTRMYFDTISNTSKPFFCFDYCIELAGEIADFIRLNTDICRKDMVSPEPRNSVYYLDDGNIVKYSFMPEVEDCDKLDRLFKETVERISNQGDAKHFIEHILVNEDRYRYPAEIHKMMHEEYGLFDIEKHEDEECFELYLEWNVAHFFIHLINLLHSEIYRYRGGPERDRKARLIICGGRHFKDYERLESTMNEVMSKIAPWRDVIEIVSGHCEGADQLGELYAKNHNLPCKVFPAQWKKFGKAAGPIRNSEMVKYASEAEMSVVVAFRSPRTKGTNDTVKKATKQGFKVFVIDYE